MNCQKCPFLLPASLGDCKFFCSDCWLRLSFGNQGFSLHIVSGVSLRAHWYRSICICILFSLNSDLQIFLRRDSCTLPPPNDRRMGPFPLGPIPLWFSVPVFPDLLSDGCEVVSAWDFNPPLPNDRFSCASANSPAQQQFRRPFATWNVLRERGFLFELFLMTNLRTFLEVGCFSSAPALVSWGGASKITADGDRSHEIKDVGSLKENLWPN